MKKSTYLLAVAVASALTLTGCATGASAPAPAVTSPVSPDATPEAQANDADREFVQQMRPHHEQAVAMSDTLLQKQGIDPAVTALAEEIRTGQLPEIEQLSAWAGEWGVAAMSGMDHDMSGMMSDADMDELSAAEGADAEGLFLTQMIEHHTGAIAMARAEIQDGENPDAVAMAEAIASTQESEIARIRDLLDS